MFTQAVVTASRFTFPYIGLRRTASGEVRATMGAFVMVNNEGWALTSAHLVDDIIACERDREEFASGKLHEETSPERCARHVELWSVPGFEHSRPRLTKAMVSPLPDVALIRLESLQALPVDDLPVLRDVEADPLLQGTSVCRYGYPFHVVNAEYDVESDEFALQPGSLPVPSFALDGMVARFHRVSADDGTSALFVETSTPGLKGQSGGPLLDTRGRVCGLQSHTVHLDLGFDARFEDEGVYTTERQFLNVGAASHVEGIMAMLDEAGVEYRKG
jgi:hypothetical protein